MVPFVWFVSFVVASCLTRSPHQAGPDLRLAGEPAVWHFPACAAQDRQLVADLERAGFERIHGGKGSHRKFVHPKYPGFVLISGRDGDDAQHYQERQVRNGVWQVQS